MHLARLYDDTELSMPVCIVRGKKPGPTLFISGAIHGDEIIGPEVIGRILQDKRLRQIHGTLIAIPVINVFGYNARSRYLPDRRDLNRCFPGSADGSLGSRVAHLFLHEIVKKCDYGIDLHSGSNHRYNLPQIRAYFEEGSELEAMARAFGTPVILNSRIRDGSLREAAIDLGVKTLLFEGGEGLRHDDKLIRLAIRGIYSVMAQIGMIANQKPKHMLQESLIAKGSHWLRAPVSGNFTPTKRIGAKVEKGDIVGFVKNIFGEKIGSIASRTSGIIIGQKLLPLVNKGDAVFHVAIFQDSDELDLVSDLVGDYVEGEGLSS